MGISGLLRNLKKCTTKKNLHQYKGQRVGIDTYAWLHRIIKGQSGREIILGKESKKYVNECMKKIDKIVKMGVDVILVFDGGLLPRKQKQQQIRRKKRQDNFEKSKQLIVKGNTEQGFRKMIDSIDISPDIAYMVVEELKIRGIKFIIAPYEADAQLAYLSRQQLVDIVITEDSDLLAFGAKKIFYKLDFLSLDGEQICLESIKNEQETGFNLFTHCMFLSTCIMAGCDYLDEIKGIGMNTAQKVISKNYTLKKSLMTLCQLSKKKQIPQCYEENFMKAMLTFRFQRVYCPLKKKCVSVNEMDTKKWREIKEIEKCQYWYEEVLDLQLLEFALKLPLDELHEDWQFLGTKLSDEIARKIAQGELNPITHKQYDRNCLEKLRYQWLDSTPYYKNISIISERVISSSQTVYKGGVEKKNMQIVIRQIEDQGREEEQQLFNSFPMVTNTVIKRKQLKLTNDSDEKEKLKVLHEHIVIQQSQPISQQSSDSSSEPINQKSPKSQTIASQGNSPEFRNKLQQLSEKMFVKIFSDKYLQAPFSS